MLDTIRKRHAEIHGESDVDHITGANERGCIVDSYNATSKLREIITALDNPDTSDIGKLKLGILLFRGLYRVILCPRDKRLKAIENIKKVVLECSLNAILRLSFTTYTDIDAAYDISQGLFNIGIREHMVRSQYFQILKYILHYPDRDRELYGLILTELEGVFYSEDTSIYDKMEIADIFILCGQAEMGRRFLDFIREEEARLQGIAVSAISAPSIVDDSQNVHASDINNSNLRISVKLIELYGCQDIDMMKVKSQLLEFFPDKEDDIAKVLERITIDTSRFTLEQNSFSLYNLFCALWSFIQRVTTNKDELVKRLGEEMIQSSGYCATGHLGRLVSVIQGFTENPDLQMTISVYQYMKIVIPRILDKSLEDASEDVLDSIIDTCKAPFIDHILCVMNKGKIEELKSKYGTTDDDICQVVEEYSVCKGWVIEDGKLYFKPVIVDIELEDIDPVDIEIEYGDGEDRPCLDILFEADRQAEDGQTDDRQAEN